MMDTDAKLAAELLRLPGPEEYYQAASELLLKVFGGSGASRISYDAVTDEAEIVNDPYIRSIPTNVFMDHPLVVGYMAAPAAFPSIRRLSDVATDLALRQTRTYQEAYRPLGIDRQIIILTSTPAPQRFRAWTVVRGGNDFRDSALELAQPIQSMLRLLDSAYASQPLKHPLAEAYALTGREQEILQLIGKGLTGVAIGHLLGISPRRQALGARLRQARVHQPDRCAASAQGRLSGTGLRCSRYVGNRARRALATWDTGSERSDGLARHRLRTGAG